MESHCEATLTNNTITISPRRVRYMQDYFLTDLSNSIDDYNELRLLSNLDLPDDVRQYVMQYKNILERGFAIRIAQLTGPLCDGEQLLPPQFRNLGEIGNFSDKMADYGMHDDFGTIEAEALRIAHAPPWEVNEWLWDVTGELEELDVGEGGYITKNGKYGLRDALALWELDVEAWGDGDDGVEVAEDDDFGAMDGDDMIMQDVYDQKPTTGGWSVTLVLR